jgi:hypothetical protein
MGCMKTGTKRDHKMDAKSAQIAILGALKGGDLLMTKHRKHTPKRARRPLKTTEIAAIVTAIGAVFTGLAALLNALK